jgi:hypothetical protein
MLTRTPSVRGGDGGPNREGQAIRGGMWDLLRTGWEASVLKHGRLIGRIDSRFTLTWGVI